jgi:hypothetical protein
MRIEGYNKTTGLAGFSILGYSQHTVESLEDRNGEQSLAAPFLAKISG